jgi:hypothetical protein
MAGRMPRSSSQSLSIMRGCRRRRVDCVSIECAL